MKSEITVSLLGILVVAVCVFFVECGAKSQAKYKEIATCPTRTVLINGERVAITNVEIDGQAYLASNHGGGRWSFCPICPIVK